MKYNILSGVVLASLFALSSSTMPTVNVSDFKQEWFTQKLDHYNYLDTRTYQQRYWINDKYWDHENGPVLVYICGEYTCSVRDDRLFPFMVGAEHNALLMVLEHRYYGESQLFDNWETENFKYLSTEQALSDLASFIQKFQHEKQRKFIVVGGSYPGALSAWFRARYPHLAVASWSSSGVVQPIVNFHQFDYQIYLSTLKSGEFCPTSIQHITQFVTQAFEQAMAGEGSELADQIQTIFGAKGMRYDDFMFFFADIFVESVQYGSRTSLCALMQTLQSLPEIQQLEYLKTEADEKGVSPGDYCSSSLRNTTVDFSSSGRAWTFQYCTEFGWFQIPNQQQPMRSHLLDIPYWYEYCARIFPEFYIKPIAQQSIAEFAGFAIKGTNTFFVNGGEDPWQWAAMRTGDESLKQVARIADCDDCGHCVELYTPKDSDPQEVLAIREEIRSWVNDLLAEAQPTY